MDREKLEILLSDSLRELYVRDLGMLERDANERTITGRLGRYIEDRIEGYDVTGEYNRHGIDPKEVELPDNDGVLTLQRVMPDIIVHHLGDDSDNLLVIEAKKTSNPAPDNRDIEKLTALKQNIGYRYAVFLRLPVGREADVRLVQIRWVE